VGNAIAKIGGALRPGDVVEVRSAAEILDGTAPHWSKNPSRAVSPPPIETVSSRPKTARNLIRRQVRSWPEKVSTRPRLSANANRL